MTYNQNYMHKLSLWFSLIDVYILAQRTHCGYNCSTFV